MVKYNYKTLNVHSFTMVRRSLMIPSDLQQEMDSLEPLFKPKSIAIIGASNNIDKPSGQPLDALIGNGFKGRIYPVNPKYQTLMGLTCYPSISNIPDQVDLCIIAVPARMTMSALHECRKKGVKAVIIFTSGFAEVGAAGAKIQQEMTQLAKETGMRICGPNCMGVFSSRNALMANFAVSDLPTNVLVPDYLGFISQSGGFGVGIYEMIKEKGFGFSHFISTGNEADLQFSHYMGYMAADPYTKVIGGYLEGIKDGDKFIQAADLAKENGKPIMLIKAGRYPVSAKAAASHTGSLVGSDKVYEAVFKQKGIIRVESLEEYQTMLSVIAQGKLPKSNRVAIITSSGGSGVMLAEKCAQYGLEVVQLQDKTSMLLDNILPDFASTSNPVDITSYIMTQPDIVEHCVEIVANDPNVDILIVSFWIRKVDLSKLDMVVRASKRTDKPVINLLGGSDEKAFEALDYLNKHLVTAYKGPDFPLKAISALAKYNKFIQSRQYATVSSPDDAKIKAGHILANLTPGTKLTEYIAKQVLRAYGIPTTKENIATTPEDAVRVADTIGYPVVMKIESPDILHKTDAGGVFLNVASAEQVRENYTRLINNAKTYKPDADIKGVLVQEMLQTGTEMIVGIGKDQVFGSTVMVGLGGIFVEALQDVSLRVVPVSPLDAEEMLDELKGKRVLEGIRGQAPADKQAILDIILRVSQLANDFPQIAELDINPLIVFSEGKGACAADALIVLQ